MLVQVSQDRIGSPEELVPSAVMARLARLDVRSRKMFAGKMQGERRSKRRGQSTEFDDFRRYSAGDDPRHIDWNAYARFGKLFVKLFLEEEDLALHVVLDASASMQAGRPVKLDLAARIGAMLAYIGLAGQNRVAITVFGRAGMAQPARLPECRGGRHFPRVSRFVFDEMVAAGSQGARAGSGGGRAGADAGFNATLTEIARTSGTKGVFLIVSDFLLEEGYAEGLGAISSRGDYDLYALQVLAPEELEPERLSAEGGSGFAGDLRLTDIETSAHAEVTLSADLIKAYKRRLEGYQRELATQCAARGVRHIVVRSDTKPEEVVFGTLRRVGAVG